MLNGEHYYFFRVCVFLHMWETEMIASNFSRWCLPCVCDAVPPRNWIKISRNSDYLNGIFFRYWLKVFYKKLLNYSSISTQGNLPSPTHSESQNPSFFFFRPQRSSKGEASNCKVLPPGKKKAPLLVSSHFSWLDAVWLGMEGWDRAKIQKLLYLHRKLPLLQSVIFLRTFLL